jgi:hypothetical protein
MKIRALLASLIFACLAAPALAVEVKQTVWGFDGQVVAQRFNLLSVLVDNPAANPFEGTVELHKLAGGKPVDASIIEPVYLAPYSSRWVQFYPYIKSDADAWEVAWGREKTSRYTFTSARVGKAAVVLLEDPDSIAQSAGSVKRLPANLFPAHSTATDCLAAVVLDHVPRWDPARQRAFMEWLWRGGRVYVAQAADGKFPVFTGELQALNSDVPKRRVQSGFVHRIQRTRRQLDAAFVEQVLAAGVDPGDGAVADVSQAEAAKPPEPAAAITDPLADYGFINYKWDPEATLLTNLKELSRPDHSWVLIHFLAWTYLGLVFPGCILVGKRYGGDFRVTFGFLLGTVLLFSLAFMAVGRRGYNESTVVHSLAIARQMPGGAFDVTQWSNAFAVNGGDYSFTHDGAGRIYSSCQEFEMVRGEIRNGPEAHFLADMPPYSSRAFSHRGLVPGAPIEVEVVDWQMVRDQNPAAMTARSTTRTPIFRNDRALAKLTLRKIRNFPAEYQDLYVLCGRKLYRLKETADRLELSSEVGSLSARIRTSDYSEFGSLFGSRQGWQGWQARNYRPREPTQADVFEALFNPLLTRSLELADQVEVDDFSLPPDRVRLLIYAPLPESMFVKDKRFARQDGCVLYSLDVFEPELR